MEENYMDYPLWEQNLEKEIQGIFDRELSTNDEIPDELIAQAETALGM
jgi:hypothetical protein